MAKSIAELTEAQVECLSLIAEYKTSKEIGRELGLSSHAIDARVKRILSALEVASRDEAARLYIQQRDPAYQPLIYRTPDIDSQVSLGEKPAAAAPFDEVAAGPIGYLNDSVIGGARSSPDWIIALPFRTPGRPDNDLPAVARLTWIVIILLLVIVSVSLLINMAEGLSRLI